MEWEGKERRGCCKCKCLSLKSFWHYRNRILFVVALLLLITYSSSQWQYSSSSTSPIARYCSGFAIRFLSAILTIWWTISGATSSEESPSAIRQSDNEIWSKVQLHDHDQLQLQEDDHNSRHHHSEAAAASLGQVLQSNRECVQEVLHLAKPNTLTRLAPPPVDVNAYCTRHLTRKMLEIQIGCWEFRCGCDQMIL